MYYDVGWGGYGKLLWDELEGMWVSVEVGEKRARDDGVEDA